MESIFVQIASYRDPELLPTLRNLINQAQFPDRLKICIAHQHSPDDPWDSLTEFKNDNRFIIIDIPHLESRGVCWARNQIQQHYNGETYTLQLDSHHRFIENWDVECVRMYKELQSLNPKPLITTYLPSYNPENDPEDRVGVPWGMKFHKFTDEGVMFFYPYHIEDNPENPIRARFYSAHFAFTSGEFCKEVPHDPNMYFHGEEISIAARAYTHGYNLFHPNKVIAWHEYTRRGRSKHWDDEPKWVDMNKSSIVRLKNLLGIDNVKCSPCQEKKFKGYNLGKVKTLRNFEDYVGVRFINRSVQQATIDNEFPHSRIEPFYISRKVDIKFRMSEFKHKDYEFVAVIFQDVYGHELYRRDYTQIDIQTWDDVLLKIDYIGRQPHQWIAWGYRKKQGWSDKIQRAFTI